MRSRKSDFSVRSRCSKNLIAVGEDIEGGEELAEPNELVAEAVACHGRGKSATLCACLDKEDPDVTEALYYLSNAKLELSSTLLFKSSQLTP